MLRRRRKTKDEEYNDWVQKLQYSRAARRPMDRAWKRYYNIIDDSTFRGRMQDGSTPVEVNELSAIVENIVPSIAMRPGEVEIRAYDYADIEQAAIWEALCRYMVRQYALHEQFTYCIYDALVLGDGLLKVGWWLSPLVAEGQWRAGLGSEFGVKPLSVFALNTPLFEFYPDYSAKDWARTRFGIFEIDKHMDEVMDNPAYDRKVVKELKPTLDPERLFRLGLSETGDKFKSEYITLQEIHDYPNGEIGVIADKGGAKTFLYKGNEPFPFLPFEKLSFFPRPMNVWGKGITQSIEGHLLSLTKINNYALSIVKKEALIKLFYDANRVQKQMIEKLESATDEVIPITGDPQTAAFALDFGAARTTFVTSQVEQMVKRNIREISGVTHAMRGTHEVGVSTATEHSQLLAQAQVRNQWRSEMVNVFASRVLEKMLYIVSTMYEPARIAKMVGYPAEAVVPLIEPYDPGKFLVQYGQAAAASNIERIQKLQILANILGPAVNPAVLGRLLADALNIEFSDAMLIQGQVLGTGGGGIRAESPAGTPGKRPRESQAQQLGGMAGI